MEVKSKLIELISDIDVDELFSGKSWKELKIDSLSTYDIIVDVEEKFDLTISEQELKNIINPIKLVELIESKINERKL